MDNSHRHDKGIHNYHGLSFDDLEEVVKEDIGALDAQWSDVDYNVLYHK